MWIGAALLLYVLAALTLPPLVVDYDGVNGEARAQAVASARQGILLLGGGVLAGLTLLFTWRRDTLSRDANFTDRYTEAIAQLGNESVAIRIGGIYALERIAGDSTRDRGTILDVLAAYLRHHSPLPESISTPDGERSNLSVDLAAAALVLGRITQMSPPVRPVDLSRTDLHGVDLSSANLNEAVLNQVDLQGAELFSTKLRGAQLFRANLSDATLSGADLTFARLRMANLSKANFYRASLRLARLADADLTSADLTAANLTAANLTRAVLIDADLTDADLTDAVQPEGFVVPDRPNL